MSAWIVNVQQQTTPGPRSLGYSSPKQSYLPLHFCGPTKDLSLIPALYFSKQGSTLLLDFRQGHMECGIW